MSLFNPGKTVESIGADLGGMAEQSYVTCVADTGEFDIKTVTFDSTANINQGEFFVLDNVAGTSYGVWFDIDANGTESTGAAYTATDTQIEVDIVTGDTAAQVAAKVETALAATANISFDDTAADGTMLITQDSLGVIADVTFYDNDSTAYSGGGALASANTTPGVASNMNSKYITFRTGADAAFYAWFNVSSDGSDPSPGGTGIATAVTKQDTAGAMATALASAINGNANFESEADGARVRITNAAEGNATDIGAGDSGLTISKQTDGFTQYLDPAGSPTDLSNNP